MHYIILYNRDVGVPLDGLSLHFNDVASEWLLSLWGCMIIEKRFQSGDREPTGMFLKITAILMSLFIKSFTFTLRQNSLQLRKITFNNDDISLTSVIFTFMFVLQNYSA